MSSNTGLFTVADLEKIYPKQGELARLILLHFRLAMVVDRDRLFIQSVLQQQAQPAIWCKEDEFRHYGGRRVQCNPPVVFTAPFAAKLQTEVLRRYDRQELPVRPSLWGACGFKVPGMNTEALVKLAEDCQALYVLVRGRDYHAMRCRLVQLREMVTSDIQWFRPTAVVTYSLLSSRSVQKAAEVCDSIELTVYPDPLYMALKDGHQVPGPEHAGDYCDLESPRSLLISTSLSCVLTTDTRDNFIHALSTCLPGQKSWHDLANHFDVPTWQINKFHTSQRNPIDLLLAYLEDRKHLTMAKLLRGLIVIERQDCVSFLLEELRRGEDC